MKKYSLAFLIVFFVFLALPHFVFAASKQSMPTGEVPTKVDADFMDYDAAKNAVTFKGSVHVERAGFHLWADAIVIYMKSNSNKSVPQESNDPIAGMNAGDIDRIVADRNVRMKYNNQTGQCGKAVYYADKAMLTMQGSPVLRDGDNSITGEEIKYYLNENRSEVIGGKKRVEALFSTSEPDALKKTLNSPPAQ